MTMLDYCIIQLLGQNCQHINKRMKQLKTNTADMCAQVVTASNLSNSQQD